MGTFTHVSRDLLSLSLVGHSDPIQVTSGHKFWSLDRGDWIEAGLLHAGERLISESGQPVRVESTTALPGAIRTYNLDVQIDHRYFVADAAVMAHNVNECDIPSNPTFDNRKLQKMVGKHSEDFGVTGSWNAAKAAEMQSAIIAHTQSPNVKAIVGKWRGENVIHVVDPESGLNAIFKPGGEFISGWKLGAEQLSGVLATGRLF